MIRWRNQHKPALTAEGDSYCTIELERNRPAVKLTLTHTIEREVSRFIVAVSIGWPKVISNLKSLQTEVTPMDSVVHFEMPADDRQRMSQFYANAFGWQTKVLGPEMGGYVVVTTTESDDNGPTRPGAINGGFYQKQNDHPYQYPSVVIAVQDVQHAMKKVTDAGGKTLGEVMEIPGVGKYASFIDTEGNRVGILEPLPRMSTRPTSR